MIYRYPLLVLFVLFTYLSSFAHKSTENGADLPVSGKIRVLVIFAELDCEPCVAGTNGCVLDPVKWPKNQLPASASGTADFARNWFDHDLQPGQLPSPGNITDYYYQASFGQYQVLGDYYPEIITVPCVTGDENQDIAVINALNNKTKTKGVFETANGYSLFDFDYWEDTEPGLEKVADSNRVIDAFQIIWRNINGTICEGGEGMGYSAGIISRSLDSKFEDGQATFLYDNGPIPQTVCERTNLDNASSIGMYSARSQDVSKDPSSTGRHDGMVITSAPVEFKKYYRYRIIAHAKAVNCLSRLKIMKSASPTYAGMNSAIGNDVLLDPVTDNVNQTGGFTQLTTGWFGVNTDQTKYVGFHLSADGGVGCSGTGAYLDNIFIEELASLLATPTVAYDVRVKSRIMHCRGEATIFTNEYFHAMYGGNNWHSGMGLGQITFLTYPQNFSLTSYSHVGDIPCGWDRQHLGWHGWADGSKTIHNNYLISAKDANTGNEADLTEFSLANNPAGGEYILRDHVSYGDAIRIKLPHIEWNQLGDVKNQYLWLENHQKVSFLDSSTYERDACATFAKGIHAYIQVGKDQKDTANVLDLFGTNVANPNALGSWLFPLSQEGHYDFKYRYDLADTCFGRACCWGNNTYLPIEKDHLSTQPNPFTGMSDLFQVVPDQGADSLSPIVGGYIQLKAWTAEVVNGVLEWNLFSGGDEEDAYTCTGCPNQPRKILSIATNPAPVSVYTYFSNVPFNKDNRSGYGNDDYPSTLESFENRTIHLSGLSISILEENVDPATYGPGAMKVRVRWDDYTVDQYTRWCGNIQLHKNDFNPFASSLIIASNGAVHLDRGLSPTRHAHLPNNATFTDPTVLNFGSSAFAENNGELTIDNGSEVNMNTTCGFRSKPGSRVRMYNESRLNIGNGAGFVLQDAEFLNENAHIRVKNGGTLTLTGQSTLFVTGGGTLVLEDGATLNMEPKSRIIIDETATLVIENTAINSGIYFNNVSSTIDQPQVTIAGKVIVKDNVNWVHSGDGLLSFDKGVSLQFGSNSRFIASGGGKNREMIHLYPGATPVFEADNVAFTNGRISYENNAGITIKKAGTLVEAVTFEAVASNGQIGLVVDNAKTMKVSNCLFDGLENGLVLRNLPLEISSPVLLVTDNQFTGNHVAISISGSSRTLGISNNILTGSGNGIGILSKLSDAVHINNCAISQFELGMDLEDLYAFYVAGSTIEQCEKGIRANNASVFLRDHTVIKNCRNAGGTGAGVEMHGTAPYFSLLSVGDKGCGFITGNDIGVAGTDFELAIDAELHACNRGKCPQVIPNRFDGNDRIFDIVYKWLSPVSIEAKSNFWGENGGGTGQPLNSFNYSIVAQVGKQLVPVQVHAQNHIQTKPTTCYCVGINCPRPGGGTGGGNGLGSRQLRQLIECRSPSPQTSTSIGNEYELAYDDFLAEDYHPARARFSSLGELDLQPGKGKPFDAVCQHTIRVSRVLARVAAMHAGMDNTTTTAKVKGYVTDVDTTSMHRELFTIHPNPSDGRFTVDLAVEGNYLLQVFDLLGKEQYRDFVAQSGAIDLGYLEKGVYMVAVRELNGSRSANNKVVVY